MLNRLFNRWSILVVIMWIIGGLVSIITQNQDGINCAFMASCLLGILYMLAKGID